ncbi:hypothetical protein HZA87_00410 [Candidatus Uhrbacteria bacterium]|nr:hypothetical protein [Candidatus Uhrbacteria bacterium]
MSLRVFQASMPTAHHKFGLPPIDFVWGEDLLRFDQTWYDQVEETTRHERHLLTKTRKELEPAALDGRVLLAVHFKMDKCGGSDMMNVAGGIVLWDLERDPRGVMWYELGTFFVEPYWRFEQTHLAIGDTLYQTLLDLHRDKNILGTTTNVSAIKTGMRHGMQMVNFSSLPITIHRATCICPIEKTGTDNNMHCPLKDAQCRARVTTETWERLGRPARITYP